MPFYERRSAGLQVPTGLQFRGATARFVVPMCVRSLGGETLREPVRHDLSDDRDARQRVPTGFKVSMHELVTELATHEP